MREDQTPRTRDEYCYVVGIFHDLIVESNRQAFEDDVPTDDGIYVYTYYDLNREPIYHGYTTNALRRAKQHRDKAPWASWVDSVRYRKVRSPQIARLLERRLQVKIPSACAGSNTDLTHHGEVWGWDTGLADHVRGTCRQPGGICEVEL